jgi:hypothetical protein
MFCFRFDLFTFFYLLDVMLKMKLYLASAQVALTNQSLSQADASLKAALGHIAEIPEELEVNFFFYGGNLSVAS